MNRRTWLKSMLLSVIFSPSLTAQSSRAYAKFGPDGETVGLYNLMTSADLCGNWQVTEGTVMSLGVDKVGKQLDYRLLLSLRTGPRSFQFSLGSDDISEADIRNLLSRKRAVKVRGCRSGRQWLAEEITRTEVAR